MPFEMTTALPRKSKSGRKQKADIVLDMKANSVDRQEQSWPTSLKWFCYNGETPRRKAPVRNAKIDMIAAALNNLLTLVSDSVICRSSLNTSLCTPLIFLVSH